MTETIQTTTATPPETRPAKAKTPARMRQDTTFLYLGPSRAFGLPVSTRVIYADLPPFCTERYDADPDFAACFIPSSEVGKALADLKNKGSALSKTIARVAKASASAAKTVQGGA